MSTFTMSADIWDNTSEYADRTPPPEAVGQLIEVTGVDQYQGKKNPGDEFVVVRLLTDIEDRQYKFEQMFKVMANEEPNPQAQEFLTRFIKNINREDIINRDGDAVHIDFDALEETTFTADIRHGGNDPNRPFINLYSITPESHPRDQDADLKEAEPKGSSEEPEKKAAPTKPGRLRKPGARR